MNTKLLTLALIITSVTTIALTIFTVSSQQPQVQNNDQLFQVSSLNSLVIGDYEGKATTQTLLDNGDFGLGAVEYMDGELVCLDSTCYRITTDGMAHELSPESKIAFAATVFFHPEQTLYINTQQNYTELKNTIDHTIEKNDIYAIKVNGLFSNITARSVPRQDTLHIPLSQVVANQTIHNFSDITGTLVGFYMPDYMDGVNVAKYHFHFITDDEQFGGHILDATISNGTTQIYKITQVHIIP